jgi:hypothetical protein
MVIPALFASLAALASALIFRLIYGHLSSSFFFYFMAASISLACGCGALYLEVFSPLEAIADISMAIFGGFNIAASVSLNRSFGLAGGHDD